MQVTVNHEQAGQRLDVFIVTLMPRLSRAFVQKLCDSGKVTADSEPVKHGYKIKAGNDINIDYDMTELDLIPVVELPVLYEDSDSVVINKPAGILTHSQGSLRPEATVASFLRDRLDTSSDWADNGRAGVVHRLDRATSGVIIGAKHKSALSFLQKQFALRKVKKSYIAIVEGHLKQPEAVIDVPIGRNPKAPATFRVSPNGKPAVTHYKVLEQNKTHSLILLTPQTGRTHQLRVHMTYVGHPIVGDPLYGKGSFGDRLLLHAASLEITLLNRERKTFEAPLPSEFKEYMHNG